jgi:acetylglutamate kinase
VLDAEGRTIATLGAGGAAALVASGGARDGMVAKLEAALAAAAAGVGDVRILSGAAPDLADAAATRILVDAPDGRTPALAG